MKKMVFISFVGISMLMVFICLNIKSNYLREDNILGIYLNSELQESIPKKGEAVFSKAVCDNNATNIYWDIDKWGLFISNLSKKTKCNLYFVNYSGQTIFDFDYTGSEQTFIAPVSGTYKLETWGGQGEGWPDYIGSTIKGGVGGYASGNVTLTKKATIYVNVGRENENGSNGQRGGGSTHISLKSGTLLSLENHKESIILVSVGGGGSGYIGNHLLTNKAMYCYNCEESNEESTKTISTTCTEETPTSNCAKKGNGYARITLVSID